MCQGVVVGKRVAAAALEWGSLMKERAVMTTGE